MFWNILLVDFQEFIWGELFYYCVTIAKVYLVFDAIYIQSVTLLRAAYLYGNCCELTFVIQNFPFSIQIDNWNNYHCCIFTWERLLGGSFGNFFFPTMKLYF